MIKLFTIMCFASINILFSQPSITEANLPELGTKGTFVIYEEQDFEPGSAGASQVWDFSDIQLSSDQSNSRTLEFVNPSDGYNTEDFPSAELSEKSDSAYTYYKIEDGNLLRLGTGFGEGIEKLTDLQTLIVTPYNYGDTHSDEYEGTIDVTIQGNEMQMERNGIIEAEADGYGTLIIGERKYNNVLRLKITQTIKDSLPPPMPGVPGGSTTTDITTYTWMLQGEYYPVLTYTEGTSITKSPMQDFTTEISNLEGVSYDAEQPSLLPPQPAVPENNAENVELPVKFEWNDAEAGIVDGNDILMQADEYMLELSQDMSFDGEVMVFLTPDPYKTVDDLQNSTTYYWRLKAFAGEEVSEWSDIWKFTTADESQDLEAPVLLLPENNAESVSVLPAFEWSDSEIADEWEIVIDDNPQFAMPKLDVKISENTFIPDAELDYNTTYFWKVRAFAGDDESEWSETFTFTTEEGESNIPEAPQLSQPEEFAMDVSVTPTFEWDIEEKATRWNIIISDNSALQTIIADEEIYENTYALTTELESETIYYWAVRAGNETDWGEFSSVWSFTTEDANSVFFDNESYIIKIMPNPAQDYILLNFKSDIGNIATADIIDINGNIIQNISENSISNKRIDVSGFAAGKYFIRISGNKNYVIPFVKE